jgi:hypothetical protein
VDDDFMKFVSVFSAAGIVAVAARLETLATGLSGEMAAGFRSVVEAVNTGAGGGAAGGAPTPTLDDLTRKVAVNMAASRASPVGTPTSPGTHGTGRGTYKRGGGRISMRDLVVTRELPTASADARTVCYEAAYRDGSLVCLKVLKPGAGEEEQSNFLRETRLLQELRLENVIRVRGGGRGRGVCLRRWHSNHVATTPPPQPPPPPPPQTPPRGGPFPPPPLRQIRGMLSEQVDGAPVVGMVTEFCYDNVEHLLVTGTPRRAVTLAQQLEILRQAAMGVRNLHDEAAKVTIHARLRAKRLLINQHGQVVVGGLGNAKELDEAGAMALMSSSLGSAISPEVAPYTPPERFSAATAHRDIHTDIYG